MYQRRFAFRSTVFSAALAMEMTQSASVSSPTQECQEVKCGLPTFPLLMKIATVPATMEIIATSFRMACS